LPRKPTGNEVEFSTSFLKQTPNRPGITPERMNTMTLNRRINEAFKQVQVLPALTPAIIAGECARQTFRPVRACPETHATRPIAGARQLPRPIGQQGAGDATFYALLALSAVGGLGWAFGSVINSPASLPQFTAWLAQLLG
jgi:hypothetical protein